jgi:hypothetical protein
MEAKNWTIYKEFIKFTLEIDKYENYRILPNEGRVWKFPKQ